MNCTCPFDPSGFIWPALVCSYPQPAQASVSLVAGLAPSAGGEFHGAARAERGTTTWVALVDYLLLVAFQAKKSVPGRRRRSSVAVVVVGCFGGSSSSSCYLCRLCSILEFYHNRFALVGGGSSMEVSWFDVVVLQIVDCC